MSGIQANTLVDFSVFSIYDPNDAAKRILAMPSSCKNLDSMISGILENKPKVLNEIFTNIEFKEWKDVILEEVYKAVIKALGDEPVDSDGHYRIVTDWEPSDDDREDAIFGAATPKELLYFAQGMKDDCREMATALLKKSSIYGYPFNKDFIKYIEMDSVETSVMRSAFEMMDNTFNLESHIATITDSGIKVFPNSDDIEKIIENPANWVVVPLLFKECDD